MFPTEPVPTRIGSYRILRRLAPHKGADVYLGEHDGPLGFKRKCVLKLVPRPEVGGEKNTVDELAHEAIVCSRMNDPAIVRMYDFFEHEDRFVLVLEYFPSLPLARILTYFRRRRRYLPEPAVWYVAYRLFGALAYAHGMTDEEGKVTPLIHRDVQPANVLIGYDGGVRLAGFGIAKIAGTTGTTAIGFVKGTPAYMAPEQARGDKVTERVDVYAAGLVVWEMLSGQPVVPPQSSAQGAVLLKMIAERKVPPVATVRRGIPTEIAATIDACLEPDPNKRTIRASDVVRWLEKVAKVEEGKQVLREMLVGIRSAPLRLSSALGRSTSGVPKAVLARRSMSARFPGVARRPIPKSKNVGKPPPPSSKTPPSSEARPAIHASPSSYPLSLAEGADADGANIPRDGGGVEAFVARLRPPPGVLSSSSPEGQVDGGGLDGNRPSEPVQGRGSARPLGEESGQGGSDPPGDTTVVVRRDIFRSRNTVKILIGAMGIAVFLAAAVLTGAGLVKLLESRGRTRPVASSGERGAKGTRGRARNFRSSETAKAKDARDGRRVARARHHEQGEGSKAAAGEGSAKAGTAHEAKGEERGGGASSLAAHRDAGTGQPRDSVQVMVPEPPKTTPGMAPVFVYPAPAGTVYVAGVPVAKTGEWFTVPCGKTHFFRVGKKVPPKLGGGTAWLAPGKSVRVRCGDSTEIKRW